MTDPVPERTYALVVAVDAYRASAIDELPGLADTADRFARWLRERGVPDGNIVRLGGIGADRPATAMNVDQAIADDLPGRDGDLLWIFWAGHGVLDPDGHRRLLLADATDRHLRSLDLDGLLSLYRTSYLDGFARQIAVVDACQTDLSPLESVRWPQPLSLPPRGVRQTGRSQNVWLAAAAGERAAYSPSAGRAWFSEAALSNIEATDSLLWHPDRGELRATLREYLRVHAPHAAERQHPITLSFSAADGETWAEDIAPAESGFPPWSDGADPARTAYLRWLVAVHDVTSAQIAGQVVDGRMRDMPWSGTVATDGSTRHNRERETAYLRSLPESETDAVALRPLPTYLDTVDGVAQPAGDQLPARLIRETVWRAVVLGDPGSGKTTLARRTAVEEATRGLDGAEGWRLPVLVRAAALTGPAGDRDDLAVRAILAGWDGALPRDPDSNDAIPPGELVRLVHQAAAEHRLLLIVDGLDEVGTRDERAALVADLNRLVERDGPRYATPDRAPGNQLLATSRLVGYHVTPMTELVQQMLLLPMDSDASRQTGEFWLDQYAAATGRTGGRAQALKSRLRSLLSGAPAARELAANPYLLVSLVSAVASGALGGTRLDSVFTRSDVYGYMVDDAVERLRRRERGAVPAYLLMTQAAVAYFMHRISHKRLLTSAELAELTARALADQGLSDVDPAAALRLIEALGLVSMRGPGLFGFLHLTLQEYLAGRWLVRDDAPAARIQPLLGDPRWVVPIRLGLGHLARSAPDRFAALLSELLEGPGAENVANLLAAAFEDLVAARPDHIDAAVRALVAADADRLGADVRSPAAAALAPVVSSARGLPDGRSPADVVSQALSDLLGAPSGGTVAAAARAIEELRLYDRRTAEALFHAQERDGAEYGWPTVRALNTMCALVESAPTKRSDPGEVWASLLPAYQEALSTVEIVQGRAASGGIALDPLPWSLTPFRHGLDENLLNAVLAAPPAIVRLVLCLYGGVGFYDQSRVAGERLRLNAELGQAGVPRAARRQAAVLLDTAYALVRSRLGTGRRPHPDWMTVDSPLTPRILAWLAEPVAPDALAARLRTIADDPAEDDRCRGDALAGLLALGLPDVAEQAAPILAALSDGIRARLRWRLERAAFVIGNALRFNLGFLVTPFHQSGAGHDEVFELALLANRALSAFGHSPAWGGPLVRGYAQEKLVGDALGYTSDKEYSVGVVLDTAGRDIAGDGPESIARLLATAHAFAAGYAEPRTDWDLDPLSPRSGPVLPEALSALDRFSAQFTFLRCWLLDRMAPLLAIGDYAVEAVCVALVAYAHDEVSVTRTVRRYAVHRPELGIGESDAVEPLALQAVLAAQAEAITDPYAAARAWLWLARLGDSTVEPEVLVVRAAELADPADRVRLVELAADLGLVRWSSDLADAALVWVAAGPQSLDGLLAAVRLTREGHPEHFGTARARLAEVVTAEPAGALGLAIALGADRRSLAGPLLPFESYVRDGDYRDDMSDAWAQLTCAAICADAADSLRSGAPAGSVQRAGLWAALSEPDRRDEAAAALRRLGDVQPLDLDAVACAALDDLAAADRFDLMAPLLAVARQQRDMTEVERWRSVADRRTADLATLLVLEAGRLDESAVAALPRLLADDDDRVRLRTGLATAGVANGSNGVPKFRVSAIGPRVVADLVTALTDAQRNDVRLSADLGWAVMDLVHDSAPVLEQALDLLGPEEREKLLGLLDHATPRTLLALPGLVAGRSEAEQLAMLHSLRRMASAPFRSRQSMTVLGLLPAVLNLLAAQSSDAVAAKILGVLGMLPVADPMLPRRLVATALTAADGPRARRLALGAADGVGRVFAQVTAPSRMPELKSLLDDFRSIIGSTDSEVALAGVTALYRCADDDFLHGAVAAGEVDYPTLLWAMVNTLDVYVINDSWRLRVRRVADFIRSPAGLSGQDAATESARLTNAVLDWLLDPASAAEFGAPPMSSLDRMWLDADLFAVLAELAARQPADMRTAVAARSAAIRTKLIDTVGSSPSWLARQQAARLLVLLGYGDGDSVRALLDTAFDTDFIASTVLSELQWFDRIQPSGFELLLSVAADDARLSRRHLAVQFLAALLAHSALDDERRAAALRTLRAGISHPQAYRSLPASAGGQIQYRGSFADACRTLLAHLTTGDGELSLAAVDRPLTLRITGSDGRPMALVCPSRPTDADLLALENQERYFREVEDRAVPADLLQALRSAIEVARSAEISLYELLSAGSSAAAAEAAPIA